MSEIKVMNNDEIRDFCIKKDLKIFELEQELQQRDNTIKEVREYITSRARKAGVELMPREKKLLEILDKAGSENNDK